MGIVYDPWTGDVDVWSVGAPGIQEISPTNDSISGTFYAQQRYAGPPTYANGLVVGDTSGWLYALWDEGAGGGGVTDVNVSSSADDWGVSFNGSATPTTIAYDPGNSHLYANDLKFGGVYLVRLNTSTLSAYLNTYGDVYGFADVPTLGEMYADLNGSLQAIDDHGLGIAANFSLGVQTTAQTGIVYAPSSGLLYVTDTGTTNARFYQNVTEVDPITNTVVGQARVGSGPAAPLYDPLDQSVYTMNYLSATVSVLNTSTNAVTATIPVGDDPTAAAYDPLNGEVFVANWGSNNVTVIIPETEPPVPRYTLTFSVNHAACSPVEFNGTSQANGSSAQFAQGVYEAFAPACSGFTFNSWAWQPSSGPSHLYFRAWANVSVDANGTLSADYFWLVPPPLRYTLTFNVSLPDCSPIQFNGTSRDEGTTASFLPGVYEAFAPACGEGLFNEWVWDPTVGDESIYSTAWTNISVHSNGTLKAQYFPYLPPGPLTVSLSANRTSVEVGGSAVLTSSVLGGTEPYTCVWALNNTNTTTTGCTSTSLTWSHPGNYTYRVWATDASSTIAQSNALSITVSVRSPLVAFANATYVSGGGTCTGNSPQVEAFTGHARGGAAPYAWSWAFGDGSPVVVGENATHTYQASSTYTYHAGLEVTDVNGGHAWANLTVMIVAPPSCSPGPVFTILGLGAAESVALVGMVVAVIAVAAVVVLVRWRRKKEGPPAAPSPEPEQLGSSPPPSS